MRVATALRAVATAAVLPLFLLGLSACSEDEPSSTDAPTVGTTETPVDEPSDEPTDDTTSPGSSGSGQPVAAPAAVFEDMVAAMRQARTVTVATDLGVGTADGVMDYGTEPANMTLKMDIGPMSGIELRLVDGEFYMSWPPTITPPGKFFRIDETSQMGELVDAMKTSSPLDSAREMARSTKSMTELGQEDVDGEPTTHYLVTLDTKKAQSFLGQGGELPGGQPAPQLPKTIDLDMWVDGKDLIRRVVVGLGPMVMQLDYTGWGEPVEIRAPAPSDLVEPPKGL